MEFIVGQDHSLNPSVLYADIVLPATTFWERNDIHTPWAGAGHYAIFMRKAIEPMYECRNDIDIFADLAARVGIEGYNDKTELEWLRELTEGNIDDFDAFMREGVARLPAPEDAIAFAKEIRDPENTSSPRRPAKSNSIRRTCRTTLIPTALERFRRSPSGFPMPRPTRSSTAPPQLQVAGADPFNPREPEEAWQGRS